MRKLWLRNLLAGISLTSLMFTFQACYGTNNDDDFFDLKVEGHVTSQSTGIGIEGIRVSIDSTQQYTFTDSAGYYSFWTEEAFKVNFSFEDLDSTVNNHYHNRDTIITKMNNNLVLDMKLEEK